MHVWQIDPVNLTPYYTLAICEALAQAGAQVHYVTSEYLYDDLYLPDTFSTKYWYFRGISYKWLTRYPRLRQLLRGIAYPIGHLAVLNELRLQRPNIVHLQWSRLPQLDLWFIRQIQKMNIPVVHTVHDVVPLFENKQSEHLSRIYATADVLLLHTHANRQELLERFPRLDPGRLKVIPLVHMVEHHRYLPSHADQQLARQRLGLPQNVPVIAFFGIIKDYKGLDVLAEAIDHIQSEINILIAGRPETNSDRLIVEQLRSVSNVHIYDYYIRRDDVWMYHLAADVLVFPYRRIYQSAALLTAMSFGRPVIVTNVGGLPETLNQNGWIIPPEDPLALAQAIDTALSDPQHLLQMGLRSAQIVEERHSLSAVGTQLFELYRNLVSER